MNVKVWDQYFASYIRVVAVNEHERVADLQGYMANIIRVSQDFKGSWITYNTTTSAAVCTSGVIHVICAEVKLATLACLMLACKTQQEY